MLLLIYVTFIALIHHTKDGPCVASIAIREVNTDRHSIPMTYASLNTLEQNCLIYSIALLNNTSTVHVVQI